MPPLTSVAAVQAGRVKPWALPAEMATVISKRTATPR